MTAGPMMCTGMSGAVPPAVAPAPPVAPPATTPSQPAVAASGGPTGAAASITELVASLQAVTSQIDKMTAALRGQAALLPAGSPAPTAPTAGTPAPVAPAPVGLAPSAPTAPAAPAPTTPGADPLRGFLGTTDPAERALLGTAIGQIQNTGVGSTLLNAIRDKGIVLDVVTDAEYQQRTNEPVSDSEFGAFLSSANQPPTIVVRGSKLAADPAKLVEVLAHELTHAAQFVQGERATAYATAAGPGLTAAQQATGGTLMLESGAQLVATAVQAQLKDAARFAEVARTHLDEAAAENWRAVSTNTGYNPQQYQLPSLISPVAMQLVRSGLG